MKILIDTREQLPLDFDFLEIVTETETQTMPVGDYGCEFKNGFIPPIVFERKSIPDLFGTLTQGYDRFKKELEKAKELDIKLIIIIEGSLFQVEWGIAHSRRDGLSVAKQLFTLWIKYGLLPVFCTNREEMAKYIVHYYSAIGRKALEDCKQVTRRKRSK